MASLTIAEFAAYFGRGNLSSFGRGNLSSRSRIFLVRTTEFFTEIHYWEIINWAVGKLD